MLKRPLSILCAVLCLTLTAHAQDIPLESLGLEQARQTGWVEGVVRDAADGDDLHNAVIAITRLTAPRRTWHVRSDKAGYFTLRLRYGSYRVKITHKGYEAIERVCRITPRKGCYVGEVRLSRKTL